MWTISLIILYFKEAIGMQYHITAVADPGFPVGGADLVGGRQLLRRLHFKKFVCQNERIWTLGGGAGGSPGSANAQDTIVKLLGCLFA